MSEKEPENNRQELEIKVASFSFRLSRELEEEAGPETLSDVRKQVWRNLLQIATAPTGIVAATLEGIIRLIKLITFSPRQRRRGEKRLSQFAALARVEEILKEHGGQVIEVEGRPVIIVGGDPRPELDKSEQQALPHAEQKQFPREWQPDREETD